MSDRHEDRQQAVDRIAVEPWGWEDFFTELTRFYQTSERLFSPYVSQEYAEYVIDRMTVSLRNISVLKDTLQEFEDGTGEMETDLAVMMEYLTELMSITRLIKEKWLTLLEEMDPANTYSVPVLASGKFDVHQDQIEYLRSLSFNFTDIAKILGISRMTLYRRRREFGMLERPHQNSVSDTELLEIVRSLRTEMPDVGQSMVNGRLRSMGFIVSRERVRRCIQITDPLNTVRRWHGATLRHPYSVPGPNSLWHIGMYDIIICTFCVKADIWWEIWVKGHF